MDREAVLWCVSHEAKRKYMLDRHRYLNGGGGITDRRATKVALSVKCCQLKLCFKTALKCNKPYFTPQREHNKFGDKVDPVTVKHR